MRTSLNVLVRLFLLSTFALGTLGCTLGANILFSANNGGNSGEITAPSTGDEAFAGYDPIPDGVFRKNFSFGYADPQNLVVAANGSVYASGRTKNSPYYPAIGKLSSQLQFDSSFGNQGRVVGAGMLASSSSQMKMAMDSTGRTYMVGRSKNAKPIIFRFTAAGQPDASFGSSGYVELNQAGSRFYAVAPLSGGGVVAVGAVFNPNETSSTLVAMFDASGNLDTSFSGDGILLMTDVNSNYAWEVLEEDISGTKYLTLGRYADPTGPAATTVRLTRLQMNGSVDNSFGAGGHFDIPTTIELWGSSLIRLNDGKYIVAMSSYDYTNFNFEVDKVLATGALDTSYGASGKASFNILADENVSAAAANSSGEVFVAVNEMSDGDIVVVKLTPTGALDTSFAGDGGFNIADANAWESSDIKVATDGSVLLYGLLNDGADKVFLYKIDSTTGVPVNGVGTNGVIYPTLASGDSSYLQSIITSDHGFAILGASDAGNVLLKLKSDYTVDSTFGLSGAVDLSACATCEVADVVELPDQGYLIVGTNYNNGKVVAISLNKDGSYRSSFGTAGILEIATSVNPSKATKALIDANDKIILAGDMGAASSQNFILKMDLSGALDTGFGTLGILEMTNANRSGVYALIESQDHGYLLGGYASDASSNYFDLIVKVTAAGQLDTIFATNGKFMNSNNLGGDAGIWNIKLDPQGRVVAGTNWNPDGVSLAALRLTALGQLDSTFGTNGYASLSNSWTYAYTSDLALDIQSDGSYKVVVVGWVDDAGGKSGTGIIRLDSSGVADASFGTNGTYFSDESANGGPYWDFIHLKVAEDGSYFLNGLLSSPRDIFMKKVN
ncbi:hypothetical protein [Bdellovibrio svalbardensis]|uniref:Delta-60 repeat domain-containing protein n=1 Tax=Bdellovibrio svalbardensis TaxID=2972972 RepID=A0ABT6DP94_9BACT|nr:hypothetical protein [Bdellovibrio svalbardensis]MDG0817744.1 hypothetical protein [Bdellovibrio svalbardensis]